jgi:hypothetical protein
MPVAICRPLPRRSPSPSLTPGLQPACTVGDASHTSPSLSGRTGICAASGISARELELNLRPSQAAALATAGTASGSLWPPVASQWAGPAPAAGPPPAGSVAVTVSGAAVK